MEVDLIVDWIPCTLITALISWVLIFLFLDVVGPLFIRRRRSFC